MKNKKELSKQEKISFIEFQITGKTRRDQTATAFCNFRRSLRLFDWIREEKLKFKSRI
jgi:hypothetical protein